MWEGKVLCIKYKKGDAFNSNEIHDRSGPRTVVR